MKSAPNRPPPPGGGGAEARLACSRPCRSPALAGSSSRPARRPGCQKGLRSRCGDQTPLASKQQKLQGVLEALAHARTGAVELQAWNLHAGRGLAAK